MTVALTVNGTSYNYPETGDSTWGVQATNWASAVTTGMLQKAGGTFTLTADVDFGATYGLQTAYYKTRNAAMAQSGVMRLGNAEEIVWRDNADGADLPLTVTSGDVLQFNSETIVAGSIVNADVDAAAAIALSKLAVVTASRALVSDGAGLITAATTTATEIGYCNGLTSSAQTQIDAKLAKAGGTMTGTLTLDADPTGTLQAATKAYVDLVGAGLSYKASVVAATTTNGTWATAFDNGSTVDGVVLATNDRLLIKDQSAAEENGLYIVQASGAPVRATDADTWAELLSAFVFVTGGTANADTNWTCTIAAGGVLETTAVTFVQYNSPGTYTADENGLVLVGTQFSIDIDGTTLTQGASGIKVGAGGVTNTEVDASAGIAVSKMAALTADRAMITDGSGFASAATTTATEIGYVNGLTSAVQTQLDAKVAAATLTTNNDMLYRAAGVPARLAAGSDTYILQSASGVPTWTDQKISHTFFQSTATNYTINLSTFTALTLVAVTDSVGTPVTRTSDVINFAFTGRHKVKLVMGRAVSSYYSRRVSCRLRNTTDGTTDAICPACNIDTNGASQMVFEFWINVADKAKDFELQLVSNGGGAVTVWADDNIGGELPSLYHLTIERVRQ